MVLHNDEWQKSSKKQRATLDWLKKNFYPTVCFFEKKKYTSTERQRPAINQTAGDHAYVSKDYFHHPGSRQSRYQ